MHRAGNGMDGLVDGSLYRVDEIGRARGWPASPIRGADRQVRPRRAPAPATIPSCDVTPTEINVKRHVWISSALHPILPDHPIWLSDASPIPGALRT